MFRCHVASLTRASEFVLTLLPSSGWQLTTQRLWRGYRAREMSLSPLRLIVWSVCWVRLDSTGQEILTYKKCIYFNNGFCCVVDGSISDTKKDEFSMRRNILKQFKVEAAKEEL